MPNHSPSLDRTAPDGRFQAKKWPQLSAQPERRVSARRSGTARREWFAPLDVEMVVVEHGLDLAVGRHSMIAIPPKKSITPTAVPPRNSTARDTAVEEIRCSAGKSVTCGSHTAVLESRMRGI